MFGLRKLAFDARSLQNHLTVARAGSFLLARDTLPAGVDVRHSHSGNDGNGTRSFKNFTYGLLAIAGVSSGFVLFKYFDDKRSQILDTSKNDDVANEAQHSGDGSDSETKNDLSHPKVRSDLPTYRMTDVQQHNSPEKGVWITYGIGVYDITKFVPQHPGGDKILLGAGSSVDPFWHTYQQHNTKQVLELLETFRIGNLNPEDEVGTKDLDSPWANEPKRHPVLKPAAETPFNAEPPLDILVQKFITPVEFFYVRNHLPVPVIDEKSYELEIEVEGSEKTLTLSLDELKKMPKYSVTAAIQCGGNRRSDMHAVKPVKGLSWGAAAIGNATWSGVRLRDVLKSMGVENAENKHVILEGHDLDPTAAPYAASIPLYKAMDERGDVLLAYEMNGKPLTRDHGYPVRAIVPGVVGSRNVKWLARVVVSDKESDSHWQQKDYKGFSPSTDWDTVDFSKSPAIQNLPVTSAICQPLPGEKVKVVDGSITARGYAWSGGGNKIVRVDITADGGKSWHVAELEQSDAHPGRHYSWTLWTIKIPVEEGKQEVEIWAKAVDSNYNCQPETFENTWNLRGVLSHAYHRVKVSLVR